MRKIKRITSIILAALMIVSLFAAVPMTVNAGSPDSGSGTGIGTGLGGTGVEVTPGAADGYIAEEDYLTFTALRDDSSVMIWSVESGTGFQYYKNGTWHDYDMYKRIELNKGEYVRFRGSNTISDPNRGSFSINGKVAASGNIMSLRLDSESRSQGLAYACFMNMFAQCEGLITAPELPETTLAEQCYRDMFIGCSNLTTAPELPATSLTRACYMGMFDGCSSLTAAPELPATSLAERCYTRMFADCTSLTEPPKLPATSLAEYCYFCMFYGCSNIRISDEANTFNGIKYSEAYRIPTADTATNASYALDSMFNATGGKFKGTPSLNTTYYIGKPVHTVTWNNWDDTELDTDEVEEGATPSYTGETPEKASDQYYDYTFSGWSDGSNTYAADALPAVSGDVTYTATFTATEKPILSSDLYEGLVIDAGKTIKFMIIKSGQGWHRVNLKVYLDGTLVKELVTQDVSQTEPDRYYTTTKKCIVDSYAFSNGDPTRHVLYLKSVYDVTWKNDDGTELEKDENVVVGTTPTYNGATPTKAADDSKHYTFSGWSDGSNTYAANALPEVSGDVTYTAQFTGTNHSFDYANGVWDAEPTAYYSGGEYRANVTVTCSDCGKEVTLEASTDNYWGGIAITDHNASCTEDGYKTVRVALPYPNDNVYKEYTVAGESAAHGLLQGVDHVAAQAATYNADGNIEYWHCLDCGNYYSDAACTQEITQAQTVIPMLTGAEAEIDGYKFGTLTEAITAAADGDTVTVLADTDVAYASIANKSITIDATGHTVTGGQYYGMSVPMFVVKSSGGLTLAGGTFTNAGDSVVNNNGTLVVDGATLNGDAFGIYNGGNLTVSSGSVSGNQNSVNNGATTATTTITGGSFTGKLQKTAGEIAVSGGTFDTDVDIYAAPGFVGTQLSATTFGVKVDTNPLGLAPIVGFQKKAADDKYAQGVRIVTKVGDCDLTQFDEYGYVVVKVTGKQQATANFNNMKAYGGNGEKTIKCNGTVNTIDGYGTPYVTLAVNGMNDGDQVAARFYAIKNGVTYYSNYVSTARYNGIIATY